VALRTASEKSAWCSSITAIASTPDGHGYWLINSRGGVFGYGDATRDRIATAAPAAVVGIAPAQSNMAYLAVTATGVVMTNGKPALAGLDSRVIDWKHSARHRKLLCKEFQTERNHQLVLAFDTGYLMREPIEGMPRLDHAINAALLLAWTSLQGGDLVGVYGFDALVRHYQQPVRGISGFARIQKAASELEYRSEETNFTLGLASLSARLKRRALVILFTDFVGFSNSTRNLSAEDLVYVLHDYFTVFDNITTRYGLEKLMDMSAGESPSRNSAILQTP